MKRRCQFCLLFASCWSSPDDGRVEFTGVKVDEAEGDGDGKLAGHGESDGQGVDVLQESQRQEVDLQFRVVSSRTATVNMIEAEQAWFHMHARREYVQLVKL